MKLPQVFQYQGSKRALAPVILEYVPEESQRVVEPFAGSAAISIACIASRRTKTAWLNDCNKPLAELLKLIIEQPEALSEAYHATWRNGSNSAIEHYYRIREDFNRTQDPRLLLYLLARCVKGSVRYNSQGLFNQSPDKRRLGTHPQTMSKNILEISMLMRGRSAVTSFDYRNVLAKVQKDDVVYMDPPYQGVCGEGDARYVTGIAADDFIDALDVLNRKGIRYLISYDGRLGTKSYGKLLPEHLNLTRIEIETGRSSQATLLGRNDMTIESLYISKTLAQEVDVRLLTYRGHSKMQQGNFFEAPRAP